uniref:Relaxin receptor 2 n=1 Tax=Phallusia mammillata TaxID=59560 RepID=A0A6F9DS44_9ASCI|nr:relaxin receptor 2 [Phallusia mammillata]
MSQQTTSVVPQNATVVVPRVLVNGGNFSPEEILRFLNSLTSTTKPVTTSPVTSPLPETTTPVMTQDLTTTPSVIQVTENSTVFVSTDAQTQMTSSNTTMLETTTNDVMTSSLGAVATSNATSSPAVTTGFTSTLASKGTPENIHRFYPVYCSKSTAQDCLSTELKSCDQCSQPCAAAFLAVIVILAVFVLLANAMVLLVVRNKKRKGKIENMDLHRVSLAIADILTGVQLLIVPAYNFAWVMNSTTLDNLVIQTQYRDSPAAKFGGIFFVLSYTASLFNLLYLTAQRLYAFVRPIHYKLQRERSICIGLVVMWGLAIVTSTVPAWLPGDLVFGFSPSTFLFYPSQTENSNIGTVSALLAVMYFLPYFLTVVMIIASACIVSQHLKRASKARSSYSAPKDENSTNGEIQFFVTSVLMVVGFTLTSVPALGVVIYQYVTGSLDSDLAYVICFYVSMANSLVNVLVYSMRDTKFRNSVKEIFCGACTEYKMEKGVLSKRKRVKSASESFTNTGTTSNGHRKHSTKTG